MRGWMMLLAVAGGLAGAALAEDWFPWLGLKLDGAFKVVSTYPESASAKGGLQPGDQLVAVNGRSAGTLTHDQVVAMLRGPLGGHVVLTLTRAGQSYTATLTRAALPGTAQPKQQPSADSQSFVQAAQTTPLTQGCLSYINEALGYLPGPLKQHMSAGGIRIVLEAVGGAHFEPATNRVVLYEHGHNSAEADRRGAITTLHELGHAYDRLLGYYSGTPAFQAAYTAEAPRVPPADRGILSHFLQASPKGERECFASLFACKYYPNPDRRLDRLKADFPTTFQLVQALRD